MINDTIDSISQRFANYLFARHALLDSTITNYVGVIRRVLPAIGTKLSAEDCENFVAGMRRAGASYTYVSYTIAGLERYMEFIGSHFYMRRPQKPRRLVRDVMSEAEVVLLVAATRTFRERAIIGMLAYSGLRNKEVCNLMVGDINIADQMVTVINGKGSKDRTVCVPGIYMKTLMQYLQERDGDAGDWLFTTVHHGHQLQTQDIRKLVRVVAKRANLDKRIYPHLLRHSLATNMINRGAHILTVKEQLGHQFIDTTMIYIHSAQKRLQAEYRLYVPSYM